MTGELLRVSARLTCMRALLPSAALVLLTACVSAGGASAGPDLPDGLPAATGLVQTLGTVTVMGSGTRGTICTGTEYDDDGCDGIALAGWDWDEHPEDVERFGKVLSGYFHLVGRFDGKRLEVTQATPLDEYDEPAEQPVAGPGVPCEEPAGGWPKPDPRRTSFGDLEAAMTAAEGLPDYASFGSDNSRSTPEEADLQDPRNEIFVVWVTEDLDRAERTVREHWGGMLCVAKAQHSAAEVRRITKELNESADYVRAVETGDTVEVNVAYDDGTLQSWADEEYGPDLVRVRPALVPRS